MDRIERGYSIWLLRFRSWHVGLDMSIKFKKKCLPIVLKEASIRVHEHRMFEISYIWHLGFGSRALSEILWSLDLKQPEYYPMKPKTEVHPPLLYLWTNDEEEYIMNGLGVILQNASITFCGIYIYEFKREFKKNIALRHRYVTQRKHDEKVLWQTSILWRRPTEIMRVNIWQNSE